MEDYHWLVGNEGAGWLEKAVADHRGSLVTQASNLRKHLTQARSHLVLEQVELRRRGREKFAAAERMFFTRQGLEQATDEIVAAYKARRIGPGEPVADLCCGLGGDLLALAGRGPVQGVDRDPVAVLLAEANCHAAGFVPPARQDVAIRQADADQTPVDEFAAWHIDPDRRPHGRRTTRVALHEPGPAAIERLLARRADAAVKLAPAAEMPPDWEQRAELEWIGRGGQCRQLVAWFGRLAQRAGMRRATMVGAAPEEIRTLFGSPGPETPEAPQIGRYVFEPDAAVLAAGLGGVLAAEHGLAAVTPGIAYLTGDRPVTDSALACFEVTDVLPFDLKRLKALVRARRLGRLEIKKRGVPNEPEQLRRQLRVPGDEMATLLLTPTNRGLTAILARRMLC
ncbi:MAG: class I SAM-dependent methyltransferase [Pirellulales bacterium]